MPFKTTKTDYLIFIAGMGIFLFFFLFMDMRYDPTLYTDNYLQSYNEQRDSITMLLKTYRPPPVKFYTSFYICPIVIIHRIFMILWGEEIPRLRDLNKRLMIKLQLQKIKDKIADGIKEYKEWRNN